MWMQKAETLGEICIPMANTLSTLLSFLYKSGECGYKTL